MRRDTRGRYDDYDDDEFDRPIRKRAGNNTLLWVLAGGGLLLFVCVAGVVVIAVLSTSGGGVTQPAEFVGTWKGRWTVGGDTFDSIYTFNKDGTFREQTFDLQGRPRNVSDGRWQFRNGRIEIHWDNGVTEHATASHVDARTMNYRIVSHTDQQQIGLSVTLRRQ